MSNLANVGLDPNVEEAGEGFEVLPAGEYQAVITSDEVGDNKKGTGKIITLSLKITNGKHTGTDLKDYISLTNTNPEAARIGQGQLKRVCTLCGIPYPPADTTLLYGKPLNIKVAVEEFTSNKTGQQLKSNKIKSYKKPAPVADPQPQPVAQQPAQNSGW